MAKQYRTITESHHLGDGYFLSGSLQDCVDKIQDLIGKYGHNCELNMEVEQDWEYDGSSTYNADYYLRVSRPETDAERDKRLRVNRIRRVAAKKAVITKKAAKDAADRKAYERLRKKFEDE